MWAFRALHGPSLVNLGGAMYIPFSSFRDTTVQNLEFTRQTTDITLFAVVFHNDGISNS